MIGDGHVGRENFRQELCLLPVAGDWGTILLSEGRGCFLVVAALSLLHQGLPGLSGHPSSPQFGAEAVFPPQFRPIIGGRHTFPCLSIHGLLR